MEKEQQTDLNLIKKKLRLQLKAKLLSFDKKKREKASQIICQKLLSDENVIKANTICLYSATAIEVDLSAAIKGLMLQGKRVFLPRICGNGLEAVELNFGAKTAPNRWGILEPLGAAFDELDKIEAVIVPLVAFDDNLNRLGHGKGYYDRFLSKISAKKIGVAFSFQKVDSVPNSLHDIKLDMVITENHI